MPRFFTEDISSGAATIVGDDARHICSVLRMREGDELVLCDAAGWEYRCVLVAVDDQVVTARALEKSPCVSEPRVKVRLYQALPKGDKLDFIVQKAVELGVDELVPVLTARCVSRPDARAMDKKIARLQKISAEAAKQSGRGKIPEVLSLHSFREAIAGMKAADCAILFYECANTPLREILALEVSTASIFIGSEGGFSLDEAAYAREQGIALASLGKRILRCETAPICALSALFYSFGEF